jgi:hypothetical protein
MNEAIASNAWTGGDAFADLTENEREHTLTYAPSRARLRWAIAVAAMFGLLGLAFACGLLVPARSSPQTAMGGPSFWSQIMTATGGLIVLAVSISVALWLRRRLADIERTAPLVLRPHDILVGTPPRTINVAQIRSMTHAMPKTVRDMLIQRAYTGAFWMFRSSGLGPVPIMQLAVDGEREPVLLDLEVLNGKPERIATVLSYRLQHAKAGSRDSNG